MTFGPQVGWMSLKGPLGRLCQKCSLLKNTISRTKREIHNPLASHEDPNVDPQYCQGHLAK